MWPYTEDESDWVSGREFKSVGKSPAKMTPLQLFCSKSYILFSIVD